MVKQIDTKKKRVRYKTSYPGVFYHVSKRLGGKRTKTEKVYYYRFKRNGKHYEEFAGRQYADDMTPARASAIRSERIEGKRLSKKEIREKEAAEKKAQESIYTIDRLWNTYFEHKGGAESWPNYITDQGIYKNHVSPYFGHMQPQEILPLDISRAQKKLQKKRVVKHGWILALKAAKKRNDEDAVKLYEGKIRANKKTLSPQTVKHALGLLRRLCKFGVDKQLCEGLKFRLKLKAVDNKKTEDLTPNQFKSLLKAIDNDPHPYAGKIMKLALYTGMRRSEILRLTWSDVKFERGFLRLRNTKSGKDHEIPLNQDAADLLRSVPRTQSKYIFPGRFGRRKELNRQVNRIKKMAGLPADFRPLHGLRHTYASMLASSGSVDMYVLQRLLTHGDPKMTARYAHLRDETLRRASDLAGSIVAEAAKEKDDKKVVNLMGHRAVPEKP